VQITEHFSREEFRCRDGSPYPFRWVDDRLYPLCQALEKIRAKIERPLKINSGYRTSEWNENVGGAKSSQHLKGLAVDFRCINKKGERRIGAKELHKVVAQMIEDDEIPDGGLGSYTFHCHYDHRGQRARW
jgi:uncharacterized protein YcbK (DUF882 family)|tara:strand:- start:594 stop:986 length:393 start_codon:yes stop_codon:yes gene_type:complete